MGHPIDGETARRTLGLGEVDLDGDSLSRAWRDFARANHPDLCPDDPGACARFVRGRQAYEVLCVLSARCGTLTSAEARPAHAHRSRVIPAAEASARVAPFASPALPLHEWRA